MNTEEKIIKSIRKWLTAFIFLLILSGITAFPIETELEWLISRISFLPNEVHRWMIQIYEAVRETNAHHPELSYGTDWLAFSHLVIAVVFIGPLIDPVKNSWVLIFGMIACGMIIPTAFVCGEIRQIPLYWRFVDCSFAIFGFIPLWICYRKVQQIERIIYVRKIEGRMRIVT